MSERNPALRDIHTGAWEAGKVPGL